MSHQLGVLACPGREEEPLEALLLGPLRLGLPERFVVGMGLLLGVREAQGTQLQLGGQPQVVVPGLGE